MHITQYAPAACGAELRLPLYIETIGYNRPQYTIHRPAGIKDYQLLYTQKGCGNVKIKGQSFTVNCGDIFILPPFTPHEYSPCTSEWETLWITYNGSTAKHSFPFEGDIRRCEEFETFFKKINAMAKKDGFRRRSSYLLYELLLTVFECNGLLISTEATPQSDISSAVQYISEHYTETIELSRLAEAVGCSEGYFCKIFKEHTHLRPVQYINHLRIEKAKDILLEKSRLSVAEIAKQVGYSSPSYFIKSFKENSGMTPEEYRSAVIKE